MNYKKGNNNLFTNTDTIVRRDWIESAIESVRSRLDEPLPVAGSIGPDSFEADFRDDAVESSGPHLSLVWSADERRSGT
jgi:hypothetical protein